MNFIFKNLNLQKKKWNLSKKTLGKREIIDFDENNKDEKHSHSSDESSSEASSNSDNYEEQSKNQNESEKSNQRQRFSWKKISNNQSFLDNNIIPFDIEKNSTGEKYCTE